jgi:DNA-binding response OmpR family regulator
VSELHAGKNHVALTGFEEDVQALMEDVLSIDGYVVSTFAGEATADDLARLSPHLVILSTGAGNGPIRLLDALRERAETAAIPVVVLGTTQAVQEEAHASGNVYATVSAPFDLDELRDVVRNALSGTPFESRVQTLPFEREASFAQAADVLAKAERELMLIWVQRIRVIEPFRELSDFSTREFLNNLPRLLHALVVVLRRDSPPDVLARDSDVQARARAHARVRLSAGLPVHAVIREYQVLRDVLIKHLERQLPAETVVKVLEEVNWLLDDVIRTTVAEYVLLLTGQSAQDDAIDPGPA